MWRKPFYYRQAYCRAEVGFLETGAGGYPYPAFVPETGYSAAKLQDSQVPV